MPGIHHELLGDEAAEAACAYAALVDHCKLNGIGSVVDAHIARHPKPGEKIEGVVMVRRPNAPHEGRERATLQFAYSRNTGDVECLWGHYDLAAGEAHEDFADRIRKL